MISLPIDEFIPKILADFSKHQNLILVAEPGAGKTTRVPPALLPHFRKKILVLEPRRMAAVAASSRIAEEQSWTLGQEIGYQVRFENKTSKDTSLIFMTEALLTKKILQDPELREVDVVILDEFHERSQHVDLALGLLKEAQELGSRVKIIVMSATLEAESISQYLNDAPIIKVPGKSHPLEIHYDKQPQSLRTDELFYKRLVDRIEEATKNASQDTLVFLPGVGEIHRAARKLEEKKFQKPIEILHGTLNLEEQKKVLRKSSAPRVILSTNIAESSVTIDGVGIVIDSGLNKISEWNADTGFTRLEVSRVSLSSATQRAGRAARQGPGVCYRLWNPQDELSMKAFTEAEVLRVDLSDAILWLASLGVRDPATFSWYQSPPRQNLIKSQNLLEQLGLLNQQQLTEKARKILPWPLQIRTACLLYESIKSGKPRTGCEMAAILQERDVWLKNYNLENTHEPQENDLWLRHELFRGLQAQRRPYFTQPIFQAVEQLAKMVGAEPGTSEKADLTEVKEWLLRSHPDRLCRRRQGQDNKAQMASGRGVQIEPTCQVKSSEFFLALQGADLNAQDTKISWAAALTKDEVFKFFRDSIQTRRELKQDPKSGKIWVEEFRSCLKLPLEKSVVRAARPEEISELLPSMLLENWDHVLSQSETLGLWFQRWKYYVTKSGRQDLDWNAEKLKLVIEKAAYGAASWSEALSRDWIYFFETELEESVSRDFKNRVPSSIAVGHRHLQIQYEDGQDPFVESRIQNFYGLKAHPSIWNKEVPLRLILLGPHGRPIQITKDIIGFWKSSYPEIRKEMKADYPKHKWPEDPSSE